MRSWIRWFWLAGLPVTGLAAIALPAEGGRRAAGCLGVATGWALAGLALELLAGRRAGAGQRRAREQFVPSDRRPSDGVVDRIAVAGARGEPNPRDPSYRRFGGLDPVEAPAAVDAPRWVGFPPMIGRVAVVSVFVGRYGQNWTAEEIARAHRSLVRAGEWLEREAGRWKAAVNVDLADTYFETVDDRPAEPSPVPIRHSGGPYDDSGQDRALERDRYDPLVRFSRAAELIGAADAVDLIARINGRIAADHHVWLIHHRCAGTSIAIPGDLTELPGATMAVCYAREEEIEGPLAVPPFADPITFVHEILHLFGAMDRYEDPLGSFPPRSVSDRDVMLLEYESLSRLRVDPLTAVEIGWAKRPADGDWSALVPAGVVDRRAQRTRRGPS